MVQCTQKPMSCPNRRFHRSLSTTCGFMVQFDIRSVCWFLCRQKLMPAHLVVLRPGLRWQTTGDEENSALQFRTVPTELLRMTKYVCVRVCMCLMYFAGVHCLYSYGPVELFVEARVGVYIYLMQGTCRHIETELHVGKCMWMLSVHIRVWDPDATARYLFTSCEPCKCLWWNRFWTDAHVRSNFWVSSPEFKVRLKNWC